MISAHKNPTLRSLVYLLILFTVGISLLVFTEITFKKLITGLEETTENHKSRIHIGEYIVQDINELRSYFFEMSALRNVRAQKLIREEIHHLISKLEDTLDVLENGGEIKRIIRLNVSGKYQTTTTLEYIKPTEKGQFSLETIDLRPKLDALKQKVEELHTLTTDRNRYRRSKDEKLKREVDAKITLFLKKAPPFFIRMNENASRLLYESNIKLRQVEEEIETQKARYLQLELLLVGATILLVIILGIRIARQIHMTNQRLYDLNTTLENRVEEETKKNREKDYVIIQQSKMAAMGEMISSIAHQWRQPINSIGILAQDMEMLHEEDQLDNEKMGEYVEQIMVQVQYMSKTIDDFRNFFSPNKIKHWFQAFETIREAERLIDARLKSANIDFTLAGEEIMVYGYESEFQQVLVNLFNNTRDAIVSLQKKNPQYRGYIQITAQKDEAFNEIRVKDNAGGIPEEIKEKIFDPYFTTKFESQGTGIGLYMSKMIVENNMNGKLFVHNVEGGAEFVMQLPLDNE